METAERILIVEDEEFVRTSMAEVLAEAGCESVQAASVDQAEGLLDDGGIAVVLTDLRLPRRDGLELLRRLEGTPIPAVVITGHGTIAEAVEAMKSGAFDFVQKPVEPAQLAIVMRRAANHGRLLDEVQRLRESMHRRHGSLRLAGSSAAMENVRRMIDQVARTETTVLVTGESGTGKELVARDIHYRSACGTGPLVLVNCAAVVENLFESEFFGHRKGAFSGAHADRTGRFAEAEGGTLVLDEIETLSLEAQAKLLRVLESGEYQRVGESRTRVVGVRAVAISNENLEERVQARTFRADLYYRLHVFPIAMPPLREHLEDIPEIVDGIFARVGARVGAGVAAAPHDGEAYAVLASYDWPGNVRELRNVLERAAILSQPHGCIDAALLRGILGPPSVAKGAASLNLRQRQQELERELITEALARADGRRKDAARTLGIDPRNLGYYLRKHGLGSES